MGGLVNLRAFVFRRLRGNPGRFSASMSPLSPSILHFNEVRFERMACGDVPGFHELAAEYFSDVKQRMGFWPGLMRAKDFGKLCEDFHRCKGGAAMFGFERLYSLFGSVERDSEVELEEAHLERFASELDAAECAVTACRAKLSDVRENPIA